MSRNIPTHMFWAYGQFSNVEKISAKSFLTHGYELNIWTYNDELVVPPGVKLRDACEILPESLFFSLQSGSCAPFSDFFRYAILNKIGGLWTDSDVVALKPLAHEAAQPFLVTEQNPMGRLRSVIRYLRGKSSSQIVGNVIFNPVPMQGNIIDLAYHYSERFPKEKVRWGEIGPNLLYAIEKIYPDHGYRIMPVSFANSIPYWNCPATLLKPGMRLDSDATFLHLYNETWRNAKVDKNGKFPKGSLMAAFAERYL